MVVVRQRQPTTQAVFVWLSRAPPFATNIYIYIYIHTHIHIQYIYIYIYCYLSGCLACHPSPPGLAFMGTWVSRGHFYTKFLCTVSFQKLYTKIPLYGQFSILKFLCTSILRSLLYGQFSEFHVKRYRSKGFGSNSLV